MNILIVNDDARQARIIERVIRRDGHEARAAVDSAAALELLADFEPAVVIADIPMRKLKGFYLLADIRHTAPHVPCIAISRPDLAGRYIHAAKLLGVRRIVYKPVDLLRLLELIHELSAHSLIAPPRSPLMKYRPRRM